MTRLIIREAHLYELSDLKEFYNENPDPHVMLRKDSDVEQAIKEGSFFICLDVSPKQNKNGIIAASAVYSVNTTRSNGTTVTLKEAGGTIVSEQYRGFGLQKIFHACRTLHKHILDRGGFEEYFSAIITPNSISEENTQAMGFEPWPNPPIKLISSRAHLANNEQIIKYFRFNSSELKQHAELLLELSKNNIIERRKNDELLQVHMTISTEVLKYYRQILEKIVEVGPKEALEVDNP